MARGKVAPRSTKYRVVLEIQGDAGLALAPCHGTAFAKAYFAGTRRLDDGYYLMDLPTENGWDGATVVRKLANADVALSALE